MFGVVTWAGVRLPPVTPSRRRGELEGRVRGADPDHVAYVETSALSMGFGTCDTRLTGTLSGFGRSNPQMDPGESDMQTARCTPSRCNTSRYRVMK